MASVNKEKCIGCGLCAEICKESFEIQDDGKATVKKDRKGKKCEKEAAESCPVDAITL